MKPEIRFARTADDVSIAYWSIGAGPTVIDIPAPPGDHVEKIWDISEYHDGMIAMAQEINFVKYDARGFGLSDRSVERFSLDAMVLDLEAVVDALDLKRFVLVGWVAASMIAIAYAASHPERVVALVLREGMTSGHSLCARLDGVLKLARSDWDAASRLYADNITNVLSIASLRQLLQMVRATSTQDSFVRYTEQSHEWDVSGVLPQVQVPVLVTNDATSVPREDSERLAAALPNASFVAHHVERGDPSPTEQSVEAFIRRVLAEESPPSPRVAPLRPSREDSDATVRLTPRELEVLRLLAGGRSNRQIAEDLVLSERTVVRHIANLYAKIDAHGRADATAYAIRHGLA